MNLNKKEDDVQDIFQLRKEDEQIRDVILEIH